MCRGYALASAVLLLISQRDMEKSWALTSTPLEWRGSCGWPAFSLGGLSSREELGHGMGKPAKILTLAGDYALSIIQVLE